MNDRIFKLNLQAGHSNLTCVGLSQYDAGVPLKFIIYDGATAASFPSGTTAKIQGVRPSGVGFNESCTLTDNVVTVDTVTDMTGEAGKFPVEIRFTASGVDVGTVNFTFIIEKAPHPDGTIDADITRQQEFVDRVEDIEDELHNIREGADGTVYNSAGDAVRDQIRSLELGIDDVDGLLYLYANGVRQGTGVEIGGGGGTSYNITYDLSHATSSYTSDRILEGRTFTSVITPSEGYKVTTVTVTMGGVEQVNAYDSTTSTITVPNVSGDLAITVATEVTPIDLLDVTWADHAITLGQDTNAYNAWSPHNLQYDNVNDCFVFLQCHANKHVGATYTTWTLSIINPYDATDVENIVIPAFNGLGMLFVENGVWTLMPRNQSFAYRTSDMGETWETLQANIPQFLFGVYKCGEYYFAGNDSNGEITYYKSNDLLNWTTESFDSSLGYSVLCETTFCEFGGKWWAFNRTNDSTLGHPVILQSEDEGSTWTLFSDQDLHGFRSTVSCCPFASYIMVVDIDRDNGVLYYNKFDGEDFETLDYWTVPNGGDDFHNANIATNYKDTVIISFMHSVSSADPSYTYYGTASCDNVMLVGSTKDLPHLAYTYLDTAAEFVAYANAHLTNGVNGGSYTWDASNGARCLFGGTVTTFVDEIVLPLNMLQLRDQYYIDAQLKKGAKITAPYNNNYTAPVTSMHQNRLGAGTALKTYITVNGRLYCYGCKARNGELPVLTQVNAYYDVTMRGWTTTQNDITDQTWQENLGFRRVVSINRNTSGSNTTVVQNNLFVSDSEHKIAIINYVPANN